MIKKLFFLSSIILLSCTVFASSSLADDVTVIINGGQEDDSTSLSAEIEKSKNLSVCTCSKAWRKASCCDRTSAVVFSLALGGILIFSSIGTAEIAQDEKSKSFIVYFCCAGASLAISVCLALRRGCTEIVKPFSCKDS